MGVSSKPREISLSTPRLKLAGRVWGNPQGLPVLALHGWLDNAASFDRLLPLLPLDQLNIVALDLPGHGKSQHRGKGENYHLLENLVDILAAVDQLGWQRFLLLGHSLGGALAMLVAATYPERVSCLLLIDALGPLPSVEHETPRQLRKVIDRNLQGSGDKRLYSSPEEAVAARQNGVSVLSRDAAATIVRRNLRKYQDGYQWRTDSRLRWPSMQRMSEAQVLACLAAIDCPTMLVIGRKGFVDPEQALIKQRLQQIRQLRLEWADGGHHLHLEPYPEQAAELIKDALQTWSLISAV